MPKHSSPAPGYDEAIAHIQGMVQPPGFIMGCLYPQPSEGSMFVSVDLCVATKSGSYKVVKRWGEVVRPNRPEVVQGAVFRACFQAGQYLSSMSSTELVKLLRWQADVL